MLIKELFPPELFKGKTVFVTGGGSGINLGVASNFAALGAHVAICGRTQDRLDAAAAGLRSLNAHAGAKILTAVADVRDPVALEAAFGRTQAEIGAIDVLVAGAAGNFVCPAEDLSPNGFRTVIEIDLLGAFHSSRLAFAQLKQTRGCLIYISASQASVPQAHQAHVGAAKAGIDNLMKNLALEWGRHGVRANSIVPGPIDATEGFKRMARTTGRDRDSGRARPRIDHHHAAALEVADVSRREPGPVMSRDRGDAHRTARSADRWCAGRNRDGRALGSGLVDCLVD